MTLQQIEALVREVVGEKTDVGTDFDAAADFASLDIDSLQFIEVMVGVEKRLGVKLPEEQYRNMRTLQGAVSTLSAVLQDPAAS